MKQKDLVLVAAFTFITVVAWIIFSVYHTQVTSTITPAQEQKIEPIEPMFNTSLIEQIKRERKPVLILPETIPATKSATPTLNVSPIASPSPTASPSNNL